MRHHVRGYFGDGVVQIHAIAVVRIHDAVGVIDVRQADGVANLVHKSEPECPRAEAAPIAFVVVVFGTERQNEDGCIPSAGNRSA